MNNKINSNEYLTKYFNGTRLYPINLINYFKHYHNYNFYYQHNDNNFDGSFDIILDYQDAYRLITSNIFQPLTIYKWNLSSAASSKITNITNNLADKRIYIPGITPQSYYHLSRGNGKSIRELCYFLKLISVSEKSQFSYNPYSPRYTVQNYKSDMENLYKAMICKKLIVSLSTNNITKQRSNNKEEMSCLKIIADRNNTNKKFHK